RRYRLRQCRRFRDGHAAGRLARDSPGRRALMATAKTRPPVRERIAVEEGFMVPEVAAAARALDEKLGLAGPVSESRKAMFRDLIDLGVGRLKQMDEDGITKQLIVIGSPGVQAFDAVQGHELSKMVNDRLAAACRAHPDRFAGLAAVAPQAPENAGRELERAVKSLGLKGAHINSHTHGEYLDDTKFWPIFESAVALDVPIYIHPREPSPGMAKPLSMPGFRVAWGYAVETGTHIMRLMAGGVFDRFPSLKIVIGHMGENIPFSLERIDNRYLWEIAMAALGIDNLLFAADWPFEIARSAVDTVDALPISEADKQKLYADNAKRVFKL